MEIRKVARSEIESVLDLIDEFDRVKAERLSEFRLSEIYESLNHNGGCVVGVFLEERMVATCTVNICANFSWSGQSYAMIENVIVTKSERNKGFGKAVLAFAKDYALDLGCYKVALMTGSKKPATLHFYESAGFSGDKVGFQVRQQQS